MLNFSIKQWALWDLSESAEFIGQEATYSGKPELIGVKPMVKRRMPMLARAIYELTQGHKQMPIVYASKNGELSRTIKLIRQFGGDLSPALFSMSVNNAIPGLLSVIGEDNSSYTVIDSMSGVIEMAVYEAVSLLDQHAAIKVVYFEESSCPELAENLSNPDLGLVFFMVIKPGDTFSLRVTGEAISDYVSHNSNINIKDYLALLNGQTNSIQHSNARNTWYWERHCNE